MERKVHLAARDVTCFAYQTEILFQNENNFFSIKIAEPLITIHLVFFCWFWSGSDEIGLFVFRKEMPLSWRDYQRKACVTALS